MGCNITILDPKDWGIQFLGPPYPRRTVTDWALAQGADLCWNLGLFEMDTGQPDCYVHSRGKDICYGGEKYSDVLWINGTNACCGYSNGIKDGVLDIRKKLGGSALRNGIGKTSDGKIIIAQTDAVSTEKTFCTNVNKKVKSLGLQVALFLLQDGGGSTSEYSNISKLGFYPGGSRRVVTVTVAYRLKKQKILRVLKRGCKGEDVKILQTILGGLDCDGDFGSKTDLRVKAAQRSLGLVPDGSVGPLTKAKLGL